MSIDLADSIKNTLVTLFDDQSLLGAHHPKVQVWFYYVFSWLNYVPFVNLAWVVSLWGRSIWFVVHGWNYFWWMLLFYFFFEFFWLWILDGWGLIEMDWLYTIFAPKDEDGHYRFIDDWVAVNTWSFAYTIEVIEKDTGVAFDANNETHMLKLKDFTWPYLFEQMNMINYLESSMWITNTFWFLLCPQMYVDGDGNALDGYPLMMAKSHELSKMYWGDYSWMLHPFTRELKIDQFTFFGTMVNILWGSLLYSFNHILGDIPAYISIWLQIFGYFF